MTGLVRCDVGVNRDSAVSRDSKRLFLSISSVGMRLDIEVYKERERELLVRLFCFFVS